MSLFMILYIECRPGIITLAIAIILSVEFVKSGALYREDVSREKDEGGAEFLMEPIIITSAKPSDPRLTTINGKQRLATSI